MDHKFFRKILDELTNLPNNQTTQNQVISTQPVSNTTPQPVSNAQPQAGAAPTGQQQPMQPASVGTKPAIAAQPAMSTAKPPIQPQSTAAVPGNTQNIPPNQNTSMEEEISEDELSEIIRLINLRK